MPQQVIDFLHLMDDHPYLYSVLLVAAGAVAAKLADLLFTHIVNRLTTRTQTDLDDEIINQMHRPVQLSVFTGAVVMALHLVIADEGYRGHVTKIFFSFMVLLWTGVAIRASRKFFHAVMKRRHATSSLVQTLPLINNLLLIMLLAHCAFWLFEVWKINVTPLLASAGIITAAVALASKDTLANFFGGISVFVDRPYRMGDYIILEGGERGEVVEIGVRSTRLKTRDDVLITVPNAVISNSKIINQSGLVPRYRVRADIGVSYDSDVDQVEEVLMSCLEGIPEILKTPTPRVRFRSFGDSALHFQLMAWIRRPGDQGRVLHLINKNIMHKLTKAGIGIPYPQRVLHMPKGKGAED